MNNQKLFIVSAISLALAACGDGNGGHKYSSSTGTAIDGYLVNSTIVCDEDDDGVQDAAERFVLSDDNGDFRFSPGCTSPIFAVGGTNKVSDTVSYPFTGILKAPAGSTVVTPLTTLLAESGMTQEDLVTLLGLPAGTDILNTDPVALAEEDPTNPANIALLQTSLAIQQMMNEIAEVFASAPGDTDTFALVAQTLATQLENATTPLFDASGNLNTSILDDTLTAVNTEFGDVIPAGQLNTLSGAITTQAENLVTATTLDEIENEAEVVQNPDTPPVILTPAQQNYLYMNQNMFMFNGDTEIFIDQFIAGTAPSVTSPIESIDFDFDITGTPTINQNVSIGVTMTEKAGGSDRRLEVILTDVTIVLTGAQLAVTVPAQAKAYVFGDPASGANFNVMLNNLAANTVTVDSNNKISLDYQDILQKVKDGESNPTVKNNIDSLMNLIGEYDVKMVVSNLNFRYANKDALPILTVSVTGATDGSGKTVPGITGYGLQGSLEFVAAPAP